MLLSIRQMSKSRANVGERYRYKGSVNDVKIGASIVSAVKLRITK